MAPPDPVAPFITHWSKAAVLDKSAEYIVANGSMSSNQSEGWKLAAEDHALDHVQAENV